MIVTVKYFGSLTDITNKREEKMQFESESLSVHFLKSNLEMVYNGFQNANYAVAVNQSLCTLEAMIKDQDVIAFLPPFAGG